jgi:hypothetical protein
MYHFQFQINKTKRVYRNIGMKDEKMKKNTAKQQEITLFGLQLFFAGSERIFVSLPAFSLTKDVCTHNFTYLKT